MSGVLATRTAVRALGGLRRERSLSSFAAAVASAPPTALALLAPQQGITFSYGELDDKARRLAAGLAEIGVRPGSLVISDVPNVAENLVLQLALSHLGAAIATPRKDADALAKLLDKHEVRAAVGTTNAAACFGTGLAGIGLPFVHLDAGADGAAEVHADAAPAATFEELLALAPRGELPASGGASLLGVYGTAALSQAEALALGADAAEKLGVGPDDRVCCSVTLMHAFGIGSSVGTALTSGAAVVLPAVGGIKGCGDPQQRADVTAEVLRTAQATILFGDTHTLRAMAAPAGAPAAAGAPPLVLRGGAIKIGSGSTFLDEVRHAPAGPKGGGPLPLEYEGVRLHAIGPAPKAV